MIMARKNVSPCLKYIEMEYIQREDFEVYHCLEKEPILDEKKTEKEVKMYQMLKLFVEIIQTYQL